MNDNVTLLVSSCDKYEDSWYPYFELVKKYWPQHPGKIALITETKQYSTEGLNIKTYNYPESYTWSERLYRTLESIETKYIIFSLEDFFLLDYVKQERIDECIKWMDENENIVECRLCGSDLNKLKKTEKYGDFYIADSTVGYRLDTQVALWNKEALMSFIDLSETPWQFERLGSQRIKSSEKTFLWYHVDDIENIENLIFPYKIEQYLGYGIAWGKWLWNNKAWFEKNGIYNVNYRRLGKISKKNADFRFKHLYNQNPTKFDKLIRKIWKIISLVSKVKSNIFAFGLRKGIAVSWNKR